MVILRQPYIGCGTGVLPSVAEPRFKANIAKSGKNAVAPLMAVLTVLAPVVVAPMVVVVAVVVVLAMVSAYLGGGKALGAKVYPPSSKRNSLVV